MLTWRITKYNPADRNEAGIYTKSAWTSIYDIGRMFDGRVFALDEYLKVEQAYVNAVYEFMNQLNLSSLKVTNLEKHSSSLDVGVLENIYPSPMFELFAAIKENQIIEHEDLGFLVRLILREQLWCRLENSNLMFVHFGYDYYMYIGADVHDQEFIRTICNSGLFCEEIESSPYARRLLTTNEGVTNVPQLRNNAENIILKLSLLNNHMFDVSKDLPDEENWIPFELELETETETLQYPAEAGATFTLFEIKRLIKEMQNIVNEKDKKNTFQGFNFYCLEAYFEMNVYDPLEPNEVYIELWINMGALTNGQVYGFDKGYRFVVSTESLNRFALELEDQLANLLC